MPLLILMPSLNTMIGSYGTIMSSRFTTLLHEGKIKNKWYKNEEMRQLIKQIFIIALIMSVLSSTIAFTISSLSGYELIPDVITKILLITIIDVILLVSIIVLVSTFAGLYIYHKKEDPNNFLIPITTSIADLGNLLLLAFLVSVFF